MNKIDFFVSDDLMNFASSKNVVFSFEFKEDVVRIFMSMVKDVDGTPLKIENMKDLPNTSIKYSRLDLIEFTVRNMIQELEEYENQ